MLTSACQLWFKGCKQAKAYFPNSNTARSWIGAAASGFDGAGSTLWGSAPADCSLQEALGNVKAENVNKRNLCDTWLDWLRVKEPTWMAWTCSCAKTSNVSGQSQKLFTRPLAHSYLCAQFARGECSQTVSSSVLFCTCCSACCVTHDLRNIKLQLQSCLSNRQRFPVKGVQGMQALSSTTLTSGHRAESRLSIDLVIMQCSSM